MINKLQPKGDYCVDRLSWTDVKSILDNNGCVVTVTHSYQYRIAFKYSGKYFIKYIGTGKGEYVVVNRAVQGVQYFAQGASNLLEQGPTFDLDTYFTTSNNSRYSKINVHPNAFRVGYVDITTELPKESLVNLSTLKL